MNTYILECAQANSDPAYAPSGGWMRSDHVNYTTKAEAISALEEAQAADTHLEFRITAVPAPYRIGEQ